MKRILLTGAAGGVAGPAGDGVADIMQGGEFCVSEKL